MSVSARLERHQWLLLLVLPCAWSFILFSPGFFTDTDSYFHLGVARRMLELGFLRRFEWLPYTTLADPFPDMYLGQHLLLLPLAWLLPPLIAFRVGVLLLSTAFAISAQLVLRRRGVRFPVPWLVLGLLACPISLTYSVYLKGATTFLILLVWYIDAVWAGAHRRAFWLAWLSVYVYVGATVLLPFATVHLLVTRVWSGRWEVRCLVGTALGVAVGMLLNPFWPAHFSYVVAELRTIFERDSALVPGEFRGAEWAMLTGVQLLLLSGAAFAAWSVVLLRSLAGTARASAASVSGAVAALGLLAAALLSGTKMLELFVVFSLLTLPQLAELLRPWPSLVVGAALTVGSGIAGWSVRDLWLQMATSPGLVRPADYAVMGPWLAERAGQHELIVAPWDDMPGLFLFGGEQRYLAGFNVQFLRDRDAERFQAYALFYRGQLSDPERTMVKYFDGARFVLAHREPHLPGEPALLAGLAHNPAFQELASPSSAFRVFYRKQAP